VSEWISVDDRLPEDGQEIIGGNALDGVRCGEYALWRARSRGYFHDRHMITYGEEGSMEITHWMPLPDPPEEVTK